MPKASLLALFGLLGPFAAAFMNRFGVRRMVLIALAIIAAGPLADHVFEPLMADGGALAGSIGSIIGNGPGRGVALMFIFSGALTVILAFVGYALPRVRNLETELPDHVED